MTMMEGQEGLIPESSAMNQPLAAARTLSSDENELEDNVDPEQETMDEDLQCDCINQGIKNNKQKGCEWSDAGV